MFQKSCSIIQNHTYKRRRRLLEKRGNRQPNLIKGHPNCRSRAVTVRVIVTPQVLAHCGAVLCRTARRGAKELRAPFLAEVRVGWDALGTEGSGRRWDRGVSSPMNVFSSRQLTLSRSACGNVFQMLMQATYLEHARSVRSR
jgi:hypothetical protein